MLTGVFAQSTQLDTEAVVASQFNPQVSNKVQIHITTHDMTHTAKSRTLSRHHACNQLNRWCVFEMHVTTKNDGGFPGARWWWVRRFLTWRQSSCQSAGGSAAFGPSGLTVTGKKKREKAPVTLFTVSRAGAARM